VRIPALKLAFVGVLLAGFVSAALAQSSNPYADGAAAAPDEWLLVKKGNPWWYTTKPSPTPLALRQRTPIAAEQQVIDRARQLVANRPAKAFALMDGDAVVYSETKAPADAESVFFGFSMGKTVTAMAVGQAICANKLKLDTRASDVVPELAGKALGTATVHDLLRMASGAADPNPDSSVWTPDQFKEWGRGNLNLVDLVSSDRVAKAQRGVFSDYKPGEYFSYKSTDPHLLGIIVSRATNTVWNQWIQERILNPMGAAHPGLYVQDRQQNGLADSGLRMRLDDWMRFAVWVKRSSQQQDCFGDFVRKATTTQISNAGSPATRKQGRLFGGYGYLTWTENQVVPNTAWASGWGGQRISWHRSSDRMVITFSNVESWMPDVYEVARDWNALRSTQTLSQPGVQTNQPVLPSRPAAPSDMTHEQRTDEILRELAGGKQ
jgi:CubicO group peptidase (beta-lactamase class C family)